MKSSKFLFFFILCSLLSDICNAQWVQSGLTGIRVWALAVNGNYIFAGDRNPTGVYVSTNAGENWTQTSLNNQWVAAILVSSNTILVGTFGAGVYSSANNGTNWTQTSLNNRQVTSLA